jgi:exopolysaccharide biosynthesis polyprenyl glycosylphosphotransferase
MPDPKRMQLTVCRLSDTMCSIVAFLLAYRVLAYVRETLRPGSSLYAQVFGPLSPAKGTGVAMPAVAELSWIFIIATVAMLVSIDFRYDFKSFHYRTDGQIIGSLAIAIAAALGSTATVFYALHVPSYSRMFVFSYLILLFVFALGYRLVLKYRLRARQKRGLDVRLIALAGSPGGIAKLMEFSGGAFGSTEKKLIGCFLVDGSADSETATLPVLGSLSDLGQVLVHHPIDEVIMVLPDRECPWLPYALDRCDYFRVSVHVVHERMLGIALQDLKLASDLYLPLPSVRLVPEEEEPTGSIIWKRLMDMVLSAAALILLSPLFALIAMAIKLTTPHLPVFYRWRVVGYRGRRFTGYKFTTMVGDADDRKESLQALNEMTGPVFKIRDDPRVTRLGKFLRKYSLNELPQLWSVLVGDMSLVGPRPAGPHELVRYEIWHKRKLSVRPGITCYWQVRGRNAISNFDDWVKMDLEYIQKRSMWTDLTILFRTVGVVFKGTGS